MRSSDRGGASAPARVPAAAGAAAALRDAPGVITAVLLLLVAAAAWVAMLAASADPHHGMVMETAPSWAGGLAYVTAWAVMMTAMMLPSALPMIALYGAMQRGAAAPRGVHVAVFALVYLALWAATGVPVYLGTLWIAWLAPAGLPYGVAAVLLAAGLFQFTPLKRVCLRACRSPLGFVLGHWRPGYRGTLALGLRHALHCLGCCWALMVVLVAAGAMGLAWVLLIAALVAAEKLLPAGDGIARAIGVALVLLGVAVAARPDLVVVLRAGHAM